MGAQTKPEGCRVKADGSEFALLAAAAFGMLSVDEFLMESAFPTCDHVWTNARLLGQPAVDALFALGVKAGRIAALAPMRDLQVSPLNATDVRGAWITPGFVDCHTHLVWAGSRAPEIEMRLSGVPYAEIARQGGGILSTVRATRAAGEAELLEQARPRLQALTAEGVTTVEIKSGYGLTLADEIKMLRVARRLGELAKVNVRTTLLAAHAVPPEFAGRADDYVSLVCDEIIPAVAAEKLADAVDVFCEHIAFSVAQCERVFAAAQRHGLPVKGHMEQLSNLGGSQLAARFNALSVDHIEYLAPAGVDAIARSGTVAVLLPGAFYFLRETQKPPVDALRAAGVPMAVSTDLNPGTSPFASLRVMLNMACTLFGLTPAEALAGVTQHAARALGLHPQLGRLEVGQQADFLVWDIAHPAELVCEFGVSRLRQRVFKGAVT
jgi:imidazolonepropionase